LFIIENGVRVRVVADGVLLPDAAFSVAAPDQRLLGISIDPAFSATRAVFVSWIDEGASGRASITIARFRDVGNQLAQGAVVVTGLVAPPQAQAAFTQDGRGRLYLAWRAGAPSGTNGERAGQVVRFTREGGVPWDAHQSSPLFGEGLPLTSAIVFDASADRMWMAGRAEDGRAALRSVSTEELADAQTPSAVSSAQVVSLALVAEPGNAVQRHLLSLDVEGIISRQRLTGDGGVGSPQRLSFAQGSPTLLATGSDGELFVIVEERAASTRQSAVFALTPRR
jgi:hypothetical protein